MTNQVSNNEAFGLGFNLDDRQSIELVEVLSASSKIIHQAIKLNEANDFDAPDPKLLAALCNALTGAVASVNVALGMHLKQCYQLEEKRGEHHQ